MGFFYRWEALNRKLRKKRVGKFPRTVRRFPTGHGESSKMVAAKRFVMRKAIIVRKYLTIIAKNYFAMNKSKTPEVPPFRKHISHGFDVKGQPSRAEPIDFDMDSIMVYLVHIGDTEVLFYGIFDVRIGDEIIEYLKSCVPSKKLNEQKITKQVKAALREAYIYAREKIKESSQGIESGEAGAASVVIIRREKIVAATMGKYRAVVCRDDVAREICDSWTRKYKSLISSSLRRAREVLPMPRVSIFERMASSNAMESELSETSKPEIVVRKIHPSTEFIILASPGIWEGMRMQDTFRLIFYLDDPQRAAEIIAMDAYHRFSKGKIGCIVIHICIR